MRYRDDDELIGVYLVDDAVWKPAEKIASACATKDDANTRVL
jgi:hypothetical protein